MFSCKVCKEKDERIAQMQAQIEFLQSCVRADDPDPYTQPLVSQEADLVLSGKQEPIYIDEKTEQKEMAKYEAAVNERDKLLSGNY